MLYWQGKKFVRFVENYPEVHAAMYRFQDFMRLPEYSRPEVPKGARPGVLLLENATFRWAVPGFDQSAGTDDGEGDASPVQPQLALQGVSASLKPGDLLVVAGEVGTGKSALLLAILGELPLVDGVMRNESAKVAYVPQSAWIKAGSLRENITFGSAFDLSWYNIVLDACCLRTDIENFADGEQTEIGEATILHTLYLSLQVAIAPPPSQMCLS